MRDNDSIVRNCYRSWSTWYFDAYYGGKAPYPPVHADIVREILRKHGARTVLDAGCGPASMLRLLDDAGLARYGFDLTPEMIDEAKAVLGKQGADVRNLWVGSVTDSASFRPPN